MGETLEMALVELITKATTGVEKSVDFLSSELPDVITQLILWKTAHYGFFTGLGLLLIGLCVFLLVKVCNTKAPTYDEEYKGFTYIFWSKWEHREGYTRDEFSTAMVVGLSLIFGIVGAATTLANAEDLLQVVLAPKVYLIEYASNLISK